MTPVNEIALFLQYIWVTFLINEMLIIVWSIKYGHINLYESFYSKLPVEVLTISYEKLFIRLTETAFILWQSPRLLHSQLIDNGLLLGNSFKCIVNDSWKMKLWEMTENLVYLFLQMWEEYFFFKWMVPNLLNCNYMSKLSTFQIFFWIFIYIQNIMLSF